MNRVGKNYITPLGGYMGGHVKWTPSRFFVDVEVSRYKDPADSLKLEPPEVISVRLPWKTLAQILVTRDDVL